TLSEVEPAQIYDLFQGDQATIVGRYQGTGQVQLVVSGSVAGEHKEWTEPIDLTLPQRPQENAFIAPLWASRRVASLIDEIDLEGQTPERVKLLVDLAKRYGILTEYTAFLADESAPGASAVDRESRVVEELKRLGEESGQLGFQQRAGNRKSIEANNLSDALAAQSSSLQRGLAAKAGAGRPPGGPAGGTAGGLGGLALPGAPTATPPADAFAPNSTMMHLRFRLCNRATAPSFRRMANGSTPNCSINSPRNGPALQDSASPISSFFRSIETRWKVFWRWSYRCWCGWMGRSTGLNERLRGRGFLIKLGWPDAKYRPSPVAPEGISRCFRVMPMVCQFRFC
ncbi:MAG: hypothetical protein ACKN9U_02475, partial [Pirellulaceae bacterium]